jgi:hypothetical protein
MSRLKDLLLDADIAAEEVIENGCEDFADFCAGMKRLRNKANNYLLDDEQYLEDTWREHTINNAYKYGEG